MARSVREVGPILVVTADQTSILAAGGVLADLAVGQIGVFRADTGVSIDSSAGTVTDIFLAVGKDTTDGFVKTPTIRKADLKYANVGCYTAPVQKVVDLTGLCADCNSDYSIKIEITAANAWVGYGFQPFTKVFHGRTECCENVSCTQLVEDLIGVINEDQEALFTALALDPANLALDDSGEIADLDAWDEEASGCPVIRIKANAQALADFCGIPYKYSFPTGVYYEVFTSGFACCAGHTITTQQEMTYEQGAGADVKYEEWFFDGQQDSPYRYGDQGMVYERELNAVAGQSYHQLSVHYTEQNEGGFLTYNDPKFVKVAIPSSNTGVKNGLGDILDAIFDTTAIDTDLTACT